MDIGRHFTLQELTHSNTAQAEGIANQPGPRETAALRALCAGVLDPLREALGKAITINCAYRSPALNRRVGGVTGSQHLSGQAADLQAPGASVLSLFKLVISLGLPYDQVIYEARSATSKWLHVSHVNGSNRGEIRVAEFGPDGRPRAYPLISKAEALAMPEAASRARAAMLTYEEGADEPAPAPLRAPQRNRATPKSPTRTAPARQPGTQAPVTKPPVTKAPVAKLSVPQPPVAKPSLSKPRVAKTPLAKPPVAAKTPARKAASKTPGTVKAVGRKRGKPG